MENKALFTLRNGVLASTAVALVLLALTGPSVNSSFAALPPSSISKDDSFAVAGLLEKGRTALAQGHAEEAVIYLKNAKSAAPQSGSVHFYLAQAFLGTGNPAAAQRELNVARQKGWPEAQLLPWILDAMLAQHQAPLLLQQFPPPPATDHSPVANDILRGRALALVQIGKKEEAAATLDQALAAGRTTATLLARSQVANDLGDQILGEKLVDEALAKEPTNVDVLSAKVRYLERSRDPAKALPYADTLVRVTQGAPIAKVIRAGLYLELKQEQNASRDLDDALAVAPNLAPAIFYKAVIKAAAKDAKGAWALAQTLPREYMPSKPEIGMAVAQMAMGAGQVETGIDILHSTSQLFPSNADVRMRLALAHLSKNELSAANDALAPLENTNNSAVLALLGQIASRQNRPEDALKYLERANELGLGGEKLALRLAASQLQRGDLEDAERSLRTLYAKQPNSPEVVGPLVALLLRKGDIAQAARTAANLSRTAPQNPYGPFYEGEVYGQQGKTDAALNSFNIAMGRDPKFYPALYFRATLEAKVGNFEKAEGDLQSLLAFNPKFTAASLRLAEVFQQAGFGDRSVATLEKAAAVNPTDFSICSALARSYAGQKRWADASATVSRYLRRSPKDTRALALLAQIQIESGATDKAIEVLLPLAKSNPSSEEFSVLVARAYAQKGEYAAARAFLQKAISANPKSEPIRVALVQTDLASKDLSAGLLDAKAYGKDIPGINATQLLATVLFVAKRGADAETILRQTLSSTPDTRIVLQLSSMLKANGEQKEDDDLLRSWLVKHPNDTAVRQTYALARLYTDKSGAEQQLRQVLAFDPTNLMALNNLAWLLSERDPRQGVTYAARALKLAPTSPAVLDTYGWAKWQAKDGASALASLQRAYESSATDPEIAYHYASVLAGSNKGAEAKKILATALIGGKLFQDRDKAQELMKKLAP